MSLIILDENPVKSARELPDYLIEDQFRESVRVIYYTLARLFPGAMGDLPHCPYRRLEDRYIDKGDRVRSHDINKIDPTGFSTIVNWAKRSVPNIHWVIRYAGELSNNYIESLVAASPDYMRQSDGMSLMRESLSESHALLHGIMESGPMGQLNGRIEGFLRSHNEEELTQILDFPMGWCCEQTVRLLKIAVHTRITLTKSVGCNDMLTGMGHRNRRLMERLRNSIVSVRDNRRDGGGKRDLASVLHRDENKELLAWLSEGPLGESYMDGIYHMIPFLVVRALIEQQNTMIRNGFDPNTKARDGAQTPYMAGNVLWNVAINRVSMVIGHGPKMKIFGYWKHLTGRWGIYRRPPNSSLLMPKPDPWTLVNSINGGTTFPQWYININRDVMIIGKDLLDLKSPPTLQRDANLLNQTQRLMYYSRSMIGLDGERFPIMGEYDVSVHGLYDTATTGYKPWER